MSKVIEKRKAEIRRRIEKYENQISYYEDTSKYFDKPRPKGLDTIKAEESLPELRLELEQLENESTTEG